MRSLTLTPSRSELGDVFLTCPQDSQDSSSIGSGCNSLDDTLTQKKSGSEYSQIIQTYVHCLVLLYTFMINNKTMFHIQMGQMHAQLLPVLQSSLILNRFFK